MTTLGPTDFRVTRFASFDEAREAWLAFEQVADHLAVQSHAWLSHWHGSVGHRFFRELCIVRVDDAQGRPLLLLPLGIKLGAVACLSWLGGDITDYHGPLVAEDYARRVTDRDFETIWGEIRRALPKHEAVYFHKQPERIGPQPNPFAGLSAVEAHDVNYWTHLEGDWESFHARQVKASLRADSRRKRRRLAEQGQLSFTVATTPSEMRGIAECMIRQKIDRYVATGTYSLFNDDAYRSFFLEPSTELLQSQTLHASALTLEGRALATHWGLVFRRRFYFIMASFEAGEFTRFSPGRLLLEDLFRWCFEHGVDTFDFTIGAEPFKKIWSNRKSPLLRYADSTSLKGAALLAAERAKDRVRGRTGLHRLISRVRNFIGR